MIVPILRANDAGLYHRLILPFKYSGWWKPEFDTDTLESLVKASSVVIFNRYFGKDIIELLKMKKKYGFRLVVDIDDNWILPLNHVAYRGWNEKNMPQRTIESLMNSDFVFTTTSRLAEAVLPYNKNVEVVPNALPFGEGQFVEWAGERSEKLRLLSTGGQTHLFDLKQITSCLNKLERFDSGKYEMTLAGYDEKREDIWRKIENTVKGNGNNYRRINRLPIEDYMRVYDEGDVVLAPLINNSFNAMKSSLKILEAGCKNLPIITSDCPPYSDEPENLFLKAYTTNEWYNHIKYFMHNPEHAKRMGLELGQYVRQKYDLKKINLIRKQVFDYLSSK